MTASSVALSLVGAGGVAIGAGLYRLGRSLGQVTATLRDVAARLERLERWRDGLDYLAGRRPRSRD